MSSKYDVFIPFNLYHLIKNVYVYSHIDSCLNDENILYINLICFGLVIINFFVLFKIFVIIFFFLFIKIIFFFFKFIIALIKTKFHINWKSYLICIYIYLKQVCQRIYFYNFYKYENMFLSLLYIVIYIIFIASNFLFFAFLKEDIKYKRNSQLYIINYYLTFESNIIIEISCCILYTMRNLIYQFILIMFNTLLINLVIIISYYVGIEYWYESFDNIIFIDNIIYCLLFIFLHLNAFINVKNQNRKSKLFI